ncbi:MAG: hypothetical protein HY744_24110 [Deltaproteobacteria bacterium]|nr:hypothetical protein [Deltaproteobacteria bacterium]
MARIFLLQDWVSLSGPGGGEIVQSEPGWLDLSPFTHAGFYLSVKYVSSANLSLQYQSAPSADADLFQAMATEAVSATARRLTLVRWDSAAEPMTRWVRWRLTDSGAASWSVTFRVYLAAVATGGRRPRAVAPAPRPALVAGASSVRGVRASAVPE